MIRSLFKLIVILLPLSLAVYAAGRYSEERNNARLMAQPKQVEERAKIAEKTELPEAKPKPQEPVRAIALVNELAFARIPGAAQPNVSRVRSGVAIDLVKRRVLWAKNADAVAPVASLSKMLTTLIGLEACAEGGKLKLSSMIPISAAARGTEDSSFLRKYPNKTVSMEELMLSAMVHSCNDSCVSIAEAIDGDVARFAKRMNERAKNLGIKIGPNAANFYNANGLPLRREGVEVAQNSCSVNDLFRVTMELHKHPKVFSWTRKPEWRVPAGAKNGVLVTNTNPLVGQEGVIGLKTGFTYAAGWCICCVYNSGGTHVAVIVTGCPSKAARNSAAAEVLSWSKKAAKQP
ncbi:MAG: hypothetical protein RL095_1625 [Verrucomicrobiota bacterium]